MVHRIWKIFQTSKFHPKPLPFYGYTHGYFPFLFSILWSNGATGSANLSVHRIFMSLQNVVWWYESQLYSKLPNISFNFWKKKPCILERDLGNTLVFFDSNCVPLYLLYFYSQLYIDGWCDPVVLFFFHWKIQAR